MHPSIGAATVGPYTQTDDEGPQVHDPARLLVVCTANVCRSPLAAALARRITDEHLPPGRLVVASAGTTARPGQPASPESVRIAERWGMDLGDHAAQPLTADAVRACTLVLTMEERHRDAAARLVPAALSRTFTWLEFARLVDAVDDLGAVGGTPGSVERVRGVARAAHRARPRLHGPSQPEDVADPIGKPVKAHREMATTLVESATSFLPHLLLQHR